MKKLLESINSVRNSDVADTIEKRMSQFRSLGRQSEEEIFNELCFCILTANFRADRSIYVQKELGDGFIILPMDVLAKKLKTLGCRFHTNKAKYMVEARKHEGIKEKLNSMENDVERREWIVKNVKGIGYKEASHFLRNIGYSDVAIVDFHIIDLLVEHKLVEKPKTMSKKNYLEIENLLRKIAKNVKLNLGELDLYLWYLETGKVLK